jgi:tetratricopeptide (TPR) repeat protein
MKQQDQRHQPQSITPQRKRVFRIIAFSIPIIFFVLLELSLQWFHYGPDLSLFTIENINGKSYYTLNPSVTIRYFSRINFSPTPSPEFFLVSKPPGTFRIFCLGESTTVGFPYWYNAAFSSFLRDRLKAVFPSRSIEVINLGITATNSYTVLDMTKDLMNYEPDLLIVYDGHNEFYGVLGIASNESIAPSRWMTLLYLRMVHLRTFQLVKNTVFGMINIFAKPPTDNSNRRTLMEQVARGKNIPYGNDVYKNGIAVFQENLKELSDQCRNRNIPLILSTQVSNIRDQSPFISNNAPGISEQQRNQFQQFYKRGLEFQSKGLVDSAIVCFRSGIVLDTFYADIHYRLAQCLDTKGRKQEAYPEYILARDYDELRFRTDTKFNNLIRSMEVHTHDVVADIEAVFKSLSQDSLIGHNLILEHVHPNARGHFFIAKEYAQMMRNHGLLASSGEWAKCDTITDDFLWEHRHVTDLDEILAARKTEFLISTWPFKSQPSVITPIAETDTIRFIAEQAAHNQIDWETAHSRAVGYYLQHGDFINAEMENETIINQFPLDIVSYLKLAQIYFNQKEYSKAETILLHSLQVEETPVTDRMLGDTYLKQEKPEKAIRYYQELNKFSANPAVAAENAYMLAVAYLFSKKTEPAIRILEQTIGHYPAYRPAQELLARIKLLARARPAR